MDPATYARQRMNEMGAKGEPFLFLVDFEMQMPVVIPEAEALGDGYRYSFGGISNDPPGGVPGGPFRFSRIPVPPAIYDEAFNMVQEHIRNGDSYLVNLTFPTEIDTNLTLNEIYRRSNAPYSLLADGRFAVFSPECFVRIRDGIISSYPMKGTIDASLPAAEEILLNDPKELAEHHTIVDLIRNDLGIVARHVRVAKFRYIDRIRTSGKELLQVSSEITGILDPGYPSRIGDILFGMLPAGSVSGAPKDSTLRIIREAEGIPRGYYTGIMGRFDGRDLDSGVMIRFIEQTPSGMVFRSGGGITCMSNAESEYQELIDKVYVPFA